MPPNSDTGVENMIIQSQEPSSTLPSFLPPLDVPMGARSRGNTIDDSARLAQTLVEFQNRLSKSC